MKEVKASGGPAMVQDPATAQFDGMPRSAVTASVADYVIAPEKMPAPIRLRPFRRFRPSVCAAFSPLSSPSTGHSRSPWNKGKIIGPRPRGTTIGGITGGTMTCW
jgi:hypothetical protein